MKFTVTSETFSGEKSVATEITLTGVQETAYEAGLKEIACSDTMTATTVDDSKSYTISFHDQASYELFRGHLTEWFRKEGMEIDGYTTMTVGGRGLDFALEQHFVVAFYLLASHAEKLNVSRLLLAEFAEKMHDFLSLPDPRSIRPESAPDKLREERGGRWNISFSMRTVMTMMGYTPEQQLVLAKIAAFQGHCDHTFKGQYIPDEAAVAILDSEFDDEAKAIHFVREEATAAASEMQLVLACLDLGLNYKAVRDMFRIPVPTIVPLMRSERARVASWNINSDRRMEIKDMPPFMYTANAFPGFSIAERFPMIAKALDYLRVEKRVKLFGLQEVENSILDTVRAYFESNGLNVLTTKYNPSDMAFNFAFAYDPTLYECLGQAQIYFTLTGRPTIDRAKYSKEALMAQNLDSDFEKSCQVIGLRDKTTGKEFIVINNHPGLTNENRLAIANMLCKKLDGIKIPMVLLGDFNQYDGRKPEAALLEEQIEIYKRHGFHWDSECLQTQNPKGTTFITFPYDINRFLNKADFTEYDRLKAEFDAVKSAPSSEETSARMAAVCKAIHDFFIHKITEKNIPLMGAALDSFFSRRPTAAGAEGEACGKKSSCKSMFFLGGKRIKPAPTAEAIQEMAMEAFKEGTCPPSDHLPLLAKLAM